MPNKKRSIYNVERDNNNKLIFKDYPEFKPNLTPKEIFKLGSFGGTYWRNIQSAVTGKKYKNIHKCYPDDWWSDIPENHLTLKWKSYNKGVNKYKVKVGSTLEFWEEKKWIRANNPYGWVQWYCDFYLGKRGNDDDRQIKRWKSFTGPKGRFRNQLINRIKNAKKTFDDISVSPKIRQSLQHWAYQLTSNDYYSYINR